MFGKANLVLFWGNCDQVIQCLLISIDLPGHFLSVEPLVQAQDLVSTMLSGTSEI